MRHTVIQPKVANKNAVSQLLAWSLVGLVGILAIVAWGNSYDWRLWPLSAYQLFPVLGTLAFSIMWSHYMLATLKAVWKLGEPVLARYFRRTGYVVLACICLHPGLLIYQRFQDGYGLPPGSYESYVMPGLGWITLLGTASLLVFLAFELHRFFGKKSWWHYVADVSDPAMLAISYHGLKLGTSLQRGWFHAVWIFYFFTLLASFVYKYTERYRSARKLRAAS